MNYFCEIELYRKVIIQYFGLNVIRKTALNIDQIVLIQLLNKQIQNSYSATVFNIKLNIDVTINTKSCTGENYVITSAVKQFIVINRLTALVITFIFCKCKTCLFELYFLLYFTFLVKHIKYTMQQWLFG